VKLDDSLLFPVFEPPVAGNPALVLVDLAVTLSPVVELAQADADPLDDLLGRDFHPVRPIPNVVDDLIASVVGNPGSSQSSPSTFTFAPPRWVEGEAKLEARGLGEVHARWLGLGSPCRFIRMKVCLKEGMVVHRVRPSVKEGLPRPSRSRGPTRCYSRLSSIALLRKSPSCTAR
jgi:hypothetical protein